MSRKQLLAVTVLVVVGAGVVIKSVIAGSPESNATLLVAEAVQGQQRVAPHPVTHPLDGFIYQRVGAAAAGVEQGNDVWVAIGNSGRPVKRIPRPSGGGAPNELDHQFAVVGSVERRTGNPPRVIEVIVITQQRANAKPDSTVFMEGEIDALFWSTGALNKFVAPYYAAVLGPEYAQTIVERWKTSPTLAALCHTPTSEDCDVKRAGGIRSLDFVVDEAVAAHFKKSASPARGARR
jgi:hypothetical protein